MEALARIREFITNKFLKEEASNISLDTPLVTSGLIDSFGLIEVASFIEGTFNITIPPEDLNVKNMDTLNQILEVINKNRKGRA